MSNHKARPKTNSESLSGRRLGDFAVGELIGAGGFGAVYAAEQISLRRPAVVKVLHASHRSDEEIIERFLREAQLASSLEHPYAAHLYAFGAEEDGLMWIAMERVRGMGLDALLRTRGALPLATFVPLFERICEVVYTANEAGIIHRDLKPANVMVMTRAGQVLPKLLDFGIAKAIDVAEETPEAPDLGRARTAPIEDSGPTQRHGAIGSPHYMAPEQWHTSSAVSARTDIYALGVLTYEALTGNLPFSGKTAVELATAHATEPLPPIGGDLPPELDQVLSRAMAKAPGDRFASALDFAAALRVAAGLDGEAPLPQLAPATRDGLLADAPEPIAEAIAVLDTARNPHQARDAVIVAVEGIYRYIGLLAVAARSRSGPGEGERTAPIDQAIVDLRRGGLDAPGWRTLATAIASPFANQPEAFPIPELVKAVADPVFDKLAGLPGSVAPGASTPQLREWLESALDGLADLARVVDFIRDYPLVVPRAGFCEWWMGARRSFRGVVPAVEGNHAHGRPLLVDLASRPVLAMWPLMMVGEPAPGVAEELFLLEGRARESFARLVATPSGFELHASEPWEWLRRELMEGREISGVSAASQAPYPGLAAFTRDDVANFVGRERETEELLNRLRIDPMVVVVGPSGVGKSSFVQAGVLPLLGGEWRVITARPGTAPLATLAAHLESAGALPDGMSSSEATEKLTAEPQLIAGWLREGGPVILVIDQLEELFTLTLDPDARSAYARVLAHAADDPDEPRRLVATLRDDFLIRAEGLPGLRRRLARGLQLLTVPAPDELRRMLVEPAQRAGFTFDDESLPDEMIDEVVGTPGALALLAFTASKLWELRDRHFFQLTRQAYDGMGGVGGALAKHAEQSLEQLPSQDRALVREAFRHLVTAEGTRAVLARDDLEQLISGGERAEAVVEHLISSRLIVSGEDATGTSSVEVVHEALLDAWPRLARWRHEDAEGARLRDQIRSAARQWNERERPRGLLWRGDALLELELWRKRFGEQLTRNEQAFVSASAADAARGRRVRAVLLTFAIVGLAATAAVLLRVYRTADAQRERAEKQLTRLYQEQGRQAVLASEPMRAIAYFDEAYRRGARGEGIELMIATALDNLTGQRARLDGHSDRILALTFTPDGSRLITGGDKTARVWPVDRDGPVIVLEGHADIVNTVAVSPDGKLAATGSSDRAAVIWNLETGAELQRFTGRHERGIADIEFIGNDLILTAGRDGRAFVVSVETGEPVRELVGHSDWLWDAAVSPDRQWLVTASHDKTARIWRASTGEQVASLEHQHAVGTVQFDASGERLLTTSWDGKGRIWNVHGELLQTLDDHKEPVWRGTFSPDGELVITTSQDETAKLWRVETGELLTTLEGHGAPVLGAAFSPDSNQIATAGYDDVVRMWSRSGQLLAEFAGHTDTVWRVVFSPDGKYVASGSFDHTGRLWDTTKARQLRQVTTPTADPAGVSVAGDRAAVPLLLPGGNTGSLVLWRHSSDEVQVELSGEVPTTSVVFVGDSVGVGRADGRVQLLEGSGEPRDLARLATAIHSIAATPNGLVAADTTSVVRLERQGDGWAQMTFPLFEKTTKVAVSATGDLLAAGSESGEVGVWSINGEKVWSSPLHSLEIKQLAFTSNGRLISASADTSVHVVDATRGTPLGRVEADVELSDLALINDDVFVTSSSVDGALRIWSVSGAAQLATLRASSGVVKIAQAGPWQLLVAEPERLRVVDIPNELDIDTLSLAARCFSPFRVEMERLIRVRRWDVQGCAKLFRLP